ncbi:MAG: hypothetical protein P8O89_06290, partial [Polaribacter sp.]|nr:hypothetical protein [Polaribacter sp.]
MEGIFKAFAKAMKMP